MTPQKRGPKVDEQAQRLAQLERENARLEAKLGKAELVIDAQKIVAGARLAGAGTARDERDALMESLETLATQVGAQDACEALTVPHSSWYATRRPTPAVTPRPTPPPPNALTPTEKAGVLAELNRARFADQTPYEVYSQLLDEGRYLCSVRGMYVRPRFRNVVCSCSSEPRRIRRSTRINLRRRPCLTRWP